MKKKLTPRGYYTFGLVTILLGEIFIALFVNDRFIRPYGGDILVTVLLCCLMSAIFPEKFRYLPLWVFIFSVCVEILQYFDIVTLLGLSHIPFFKILIGSVFSWADIVCYGVGCVIFCVTEKYFKEKIICGD